MSDDEVTAIRKAILDFPWSNFGLDEVEEADPEYADSLAESIHRKLREELI